MDCIFKNLEGAPCTSNLQTATTTILHHQNSQNLPCPHPPQHIQNPTDFEQPEMSVKPVTISLDYKGELRRYSGHQTTLPSHHTPHHRALAVQSFSQLMYRTKALLGQWVYENLLSGAQRFTFNDEGQTFVMASEVPPIQYTYTIQPYTPQQEYQDCLREGRRTFTITEPAPVAVAAMRTPPGGQSTASLSMRTPPRTGMPTTAKRPSTWSDPSHRCLHLFSA